MKHSESKMMLALIGYAVCPRLLFTFSVSYIYVVVLHQNPLFSASSPVEVAVATLAQSKTLPLMERGSAQ